jgi:hypothetical protein
VYDHPNALSARAANKTQNRGTAIDRSRIKDIAAQSKVTAPAMTIAYSVQLFHPYCDLTVAGTRSGRIDIRNIKESEAKAVNTE